MFAEMQHWDSELLNRHFRDAWAVKEKKEETGIPARRFREWRRTRHRLDVTQKAETPEEGRGKAVKQEAGGLANNAKYEMRE